MSKRVNSPIVLSWILLITISLIWGSSFILIKKGLEVFSAGELGALRITMAFLALSPVAIRNIPRMPQGKIPILFILGMVGSFIPAFLFAFAQTKLDSSITGVRSSDLYFMAFVRKLRIILSRYAGTPFT